MKSRSSRKVKRREKHAEFEKWKIQSASLSLKLLDFIKAQNCGSQVQVAAIEMAMLALFWGCQTPPCHAYSMLDELGRQYNEIWYLAYSEKAAKKSKKS